MLCAPVTYEADARQVCAPFQWLAQFAERYVRFAMLPLFGCADCSVTRIRLRVGLPGWSCGPHRARKVPNPASRRSRLLAVEVQVSCWTRWIEFRYADISGEVVDDNPPRPRTPTTAPDSGCSRQPSAPKYAAPLQGTCSSQ
jgi:hypothetical protein